MKTVQEPVFRLLGPVHVRGREGEAAPLRGGKPRIVLVALLLKANRVVPVDAFSEALWEGEPPRSALPNLRSYVHRLRHSLGAGTLIGHPGGYELRLARQDSDHLLFEELSRQGREVLASSPHRAVILLRRALELWRSEQAAPGLERRGMLARELASLDGERLRALEDLAGAWFALDEPRQTLDAAWQVVSSDPLRTRAWELVLRAHHRLGEPGQLTESYRMARAAFRTELGRDPDAGLALLHDRLLADGSA
ncbi:AfsR/SARP family transcriptional regulator [Streptomyces sp. 6N223]|uniref:AfsR/SARP family transcriptional regulator n=1 Tax=Streptomyces sp. 6N223 TaxID=3457412 RepID=UPI003FD69F36